MEKIERAEEMIRMNKIWIGLVKSRESKKQCAVVIESYAFSTSQKTSDSFHRDQVAFFKYFVFVVLQKPLFFFTDFTKLCGHPNFGYIPLDSL